MCIEVLNIQRLSLGPWRVWVPLHTPCYPSWLARLPYLLCACDIAIVFSTRHLKTVPIMVSITETLNDLSKGEAKFPT